MWGTAHLFEEGHGVKYCNFYLYEVLWEGVRISRGVYHYPSFLITLKIARLLGYLLYVSIH